MSAEQFHQILKFGRERDRPILVQSAPLNCKRKLGTTPNDNFTIPIFFFDHPLMSNLTILTITIDKYIYDSNDDTFN